MVLLKIMQTFVSSCAGFSPTLAGVNTPNHFAPHRLECEAIPNEVERRSEVCRNSHYPGYAAAPLWPEWQSANDGNGQKE